MKVVLDLSSFVTKKLLEHPKDIDLSNLSAKTVFIDSKTKIDKLVINKRTNFTTSLDNLKTKINNLDFGKLKTVPENLRNLSHVIDNNTAKNEKYNTLKPKVDFSQNKNS